MEGMNPQYLVLSTGKVTIKYQISVTSVIGPSLASIIANQEETSWRDIEGELWPMGCRVVTSVLGWNRATPTEVEMCNVFIALVPELRHTATKNACSLAQQPLIWLIMVLTRHTWRFELSLIIHCHFFLFYYSLYNAFLSILSFVVVIYVLLSNPSPMHGECVLFLCANMNVIGTPPPPQTWVYRLSILSDFECADEPNMEWKVSAQMMSSWPIWELGKTLLWKWCFYHVFLLKPLPLLLTSWQDLLRNICFTDHVHLDNQRQQHKSTQTPTPKLTNDISRILCAY